MEILLLALFDILCTNAYDHLIDNAVKSAFNKIRTSIKKSEIENSVNIFLKKRFNELENEAIANAIDFAAMNSILCQNLHTKIVLIIFSTSSRIEKLIKKDLMVDIYSGAVKTMNYSSLDMTDLEYLISHYIDTIVQLVRLHYEPQHPPMIRNEQVIAYYLGISTREIEFKIDLLMENLEKYFVSISENNTYNNSFAQLLDNIKDLEQNENKFHYLNKYIGFFGRENEIDKVNGFLDSTKSLAVLGITGEGGAGKSKFIYSYIMRENYRIDWKMLIVPNLMIEKLIKFDNWYYDQNLLLIFDYVAQNADEIGKFIELIANSKTIVNKIRIILLERDGKTDCIFPNWYNRLCNNGRNHNVERNIEFFPLPILSRSALDLLSNDYKNFLFFKSRDIKNIKNTHIYRNFAKKPFNAKYKNKIYSIAKEVSKGKITPLIMLMVTEAVIYGVKNPDKWLENKETYSWTPVSLARLTLSRDFRYWEDSICKSNFSYKDIETILVYSTAIGGWRINGCISKNMETVFEKVLNLDVQELHMIVNVINERSCSDSLYVLPKEPDFIGEVLFYDYFRKHIHNSRFIVGLLKILWEKPNQFYAFLERSSRLILEKDYESLLINHIPFYKPDNFNNKEVNEIYASMLNNILYYHDSKEAAEKILIEFKQIPLDPYTDEKQADKYITCLLDYSIYLKTLDEKEIYLKEIEDIVSVFPSNERLNYLYVKSLFNITSRFGDLDILTRIIKKIEDKYLLFGHEEITRLFALSIYNYSFSIVDHEEYVKTFYKYKNIYDQNKMNNDIIKYFCDFLIGYSKNIISCDEIEAILTMYDELLHSSRMNKMFLAQYSILLRNLYDFSEISNEQKIRIEDLMNQ